MARGRRAGSAASRDVADPPISAPPGAELIDPLQIASEGLEEVDEEPVDRTTTTPATTDEQGPDPLAVLSVAIEDGDAFVPEDVAPRRGLLSRLGRGRGQEQVPADDPEATEDAAEAADEAAEEK